jgi:hypothetical protein
METLHLQVLGTFQGQEEKLRAAEALFPRLSDPTALGTLLSTLSSHERRTVHARLGLLAFFDASNPTGRYAKWLVVEWLVYSCKSVWEPSLPL